MTLWAALPWMALSVMGLAAVTLLSRPLEALLRLALRTGAGWACLKLLSPVGAVLGAGLGVNLFNALALGALGAPGLGLLLLLRWALVC